MKAGVRVPKSGRLRDALQTIERVAASGTLPITKREQLKFAEAMSDAGELYEIGHILPARPSSQVVGELGKLMKGSLGDLHANKGPRRFQSQFWLATILHRGGYRPRVPPDKGTGAPDYLIDEGTMTYGAEIKRPDSSKSAKAAVYEAAAQLRDYGVKGAVMLDLSVAADIHQLVWLPRDEAYNAAQSAKMRFRAVARRLGEVVDRDYNTPGAALQNVLVIFFHARTYSWIEGEPSGLARVALAHAGAWVKPVKNLEYHNTINIQKRIITGLQNAGFPFEPFLEIASPPKGFPSNWKL